ncbi:hypothetical protein NPIL_612921 [Nephila pilipes]|uniref:Uncharacterized protein n=1 Tax=Nephila pilipes TaxID=299642 RepID=A0A8X6NQA1_NEPPI|nr:hypothetical protein NPIL_612921 [Nephila pilipes]
MPTGRVSPLVCIPFFGCSPGERRPLALSGFNATPDVAPRRADSGFERYARRAVVRRGQCFCAKISAGDEYRLFVRISPPHRSFLFFSVSLVLVSSDTVHFFIVSLITRLLTSFSPFSSI